MNQQKIAILTDSCADVPAHLLKKYDIHVVPLKLIFRDGEYADGVEIQASEVYARLKTEIPKTTLPDGATVEAAFARIRAAGYTKVLAINSAGVLSGTYNMVRVIGEQTVGLEVASFDTCSGSLGTGLTVLQAAHWIEEGRSWPEILRALPRLIRRTWAMFCVDTLEYLQKGGRIGKATAVAGTLLQIKPILSFAQDGELINVAKVRGRKQAMEKLVHLIAQKIPRGVRFNLALAHGNSPDELKELRALVQKTMPDYENLVEADIGSTLGAYTGPHLLGVGAQILDDDLFA